MKDFSTPIRYAAMLLLFALVWVLMFRPMQKQIVASMKQLPLAPQVRELETTAAKTELHPGTPSAALETDAESVRLKRELTDLVQAEPASMTRTLQTWLREDNA